MKATTKGRNQTSFHQHTVKATVAELRTILGPPEFEYNDGSDKVNIEWVLETDSGFVFTVYDWKEYRPLTLHEVIEWHIGGYTSVVTKEAQDEINNALERIRETGTDDTRIESGQFLSDKNLEAIVNRIKFTATPQATKEWIKHELKNAYLDGYNAAIKMTVRTIEEAGIKAEQKAAPKMHPIFENLLKPFTQG